MSKRSLRNVVMSVVLGLRKLTTTRVCRVSRTCVCKNKMTSAMVPKKSYEDMRRATGVRYGKRGDRAMCMVR